MLKEAQYPIKKRLKLYGFDISIENPKGSTRSWKDPHSGESGSTKMWWDYGYIRRTEGTDGDHVDVYIGPESELEAKRVFIVNQMKKPDFKEFDEQKVMLCFPNAQAAKAAYLKQYNDPRFFGSMKEMPVEDFRKKVLDKDFRGKKVAQILHTAGGATFGGAAADSQVGLKVAEEKDMPFTSKRQQRAAFGGHIPGFSKEKAREWAHETPNLKELPDRAPSEKGKPTLRSKTATILVLEDMVKRGRQMRDQHDLKTAQLAHAHDSGKGLEPREIREGVKVEKEHTKNPATARQIAIDHIRERPDYYEKLDKMEKSPMDQKVKARLMHEGRLMKSAQDQVSSFVELNLARLSRGEEIDFSTIKVSNLVEPARKGGVRNGVGDEIPPATDFAQAIQGDNIKAAKDSERVESISDAIDNIGIATLAAPSVAEWAGEKMEHASSPMVKGWGAALSGAGKAMKAYHPQEIAGLALVAPGVTKGIARGVDKLLPGGTHPEDVQPKAAADLTEAKRDALGKKEFVFPKERKYPIHDEAHARNALARAAQYGSPAVQAKVRSAVDKKYPGIQLTAASKPSKPTVKDSPIRKAAIEKVASSIFPDLEYRTEAERANILRFFTKIADNAHMLINDVLHGLQHQGARAAQAAAHSPAAQAASHALRGPAASAIEHVPSIAELAALAKAPRAAAPRQIRDEALFDRVMQGHAPLPAPLPAHQPSAVDRIKARLGLAQGGIAVPPAGAPSSVGMTPAGPAARPVTPPPVPTKAAPPPPPPPAAPPPPPAAAAPAAAPPPVEAPPAAAPPGTPPGAAAAPAPGKPSLLRRMALPAAGGLAALGVGGAAVGGGQLLNQLQMAQEEGTTARPLAGSSYQGLSRPF